MWCDGKGEGFTRGICTYYCEGWERGYCHSGKEGSSFLTSASPP
jgi:hypothetical protein